MDYEGEDDDLPGGTIYALYEQHDDESGKFELIPEGERLHADRALCGFLYLASRMKEPDRFWLKLSAEHDKLFLPGPSDLSGPVTEADVIYLNRCGINWDSDAECFYTFT